MHIHEIFLKCPEEIEKCLIVKASTDIQDVIPPARVAVFILFHQLGIIPFCEMAEIEKVDISNEVGTGPLYETGKTAGVVKALCYYDLATT
ncbi:MAG: hypothetical protein IJB99_10605, partial [Clostridia bacterium]|nr:hypothetical protein [Clostridia bacterium]